MPLLGKSGGLNQGYYRNSSVILVEKRTRVEKKQFAISEDCITDKPEGSKVKGRASTSHIRLKVKMGKMVSQSGSKDIVLDMVGTSDPILTMFSDNRSELCWAMSSELQKFTVGIETQLMREILGTGQHLTSWESTFTKAILEHIMWIEGGKYRRIFLQKKLAMDSH